jgi:hypothetical protein
VIPLDGNRHPYDLRRTGRRLRVHEREHVHHGVGIREHVVGAEVGRRLYLRGGLGERGGLLARASASVARLVQSARARRRPFRRLP